MTVRIGVLGSTSGTDLQGIINAIDAGSLNAEIVVVLSNKENAFILERAKKHGLNAVFLNPKEFKNRNEFDEELIKILNENKVELCLLIGYMKILTKEFVNEWGNKTMNIHPSLLPAFAGGMDKNVHEEVLKAGVKETGCTLHFITEKADEGPIILQKKVSVSENETINSLKEKVQLAEQEIIIKAIDLWEKNKIKIEGEKVKILD